MQTDAAAQAQANDLLGALLKVRRARDWVVDRPDSAAELDAAMETMRGVEDALRRRPAPEEALRKIAAAGSVVAWARRLVFEGEHGAADSAMGDALEMLAEAAEAAGGAFDADAAMAQAQAEWAEQSGADAAAAE